MKYLLLLVALLTAATPKVSFSQKKESALIFDKKFIDGLDKWVVFPMRKDSTFIYGFVYIDNVAGLTFNLEGSFKIDKGTIIPKKDINSAIKTRLSPSNIKVGIISASMFKELQIEEYPVWYKLYNPDPNSINRLYRLGFVYNEWNEYTMALTYLEKAKAIDPDFKGLKAEFAFAYNALQQYEKAVIVLEDALKEATNDCYLFKELVYAQMNLGLADSASASAKKGIANCNDNFMKGEMAYNVTHQYYKLKDKTKFNSWAEETAKWLKPDHQYLKMVEKMKTELGQ